MNERDEIEWRPATREDEAFLAELYAEIDAAELAAAGLSPEALAPVLAMQHKARILGYSVRSPVAESRIVCAGQQPVGHVLVEENDEQMRLVDIALRTAFRSKGHGKKLLQELCERSRAKGLPLRLSVRVGHPARHLYERLGFTATGDDGLDVQMEYRG